MNLPVVCNARTARCGICAERAGHVMVVVDDPPLRISLIHHLPFLDGWFDGSLVSFPARPIRRLSRADGQGDRGGELVGECLQLLSGAGVLHQHPEAQRLRGRMGMGRRRHQPFRGHTAQAAGLVTDDGREVGARPQHGSTEPDEVRRDDGAGPWEISRAITEKAQKWALTLELKLSIS